MNYAFAHRPEEILIHRVIGRQYFGVSEEPLLSIKCMFNGMARYVADGRNYFSVDDDSYLILNHGNTYSVEKTSLVPVETFCLFFPERLSGDVAHELSVGDEHLLASPQQECGRPFNFIEHRQRHGGPISQHVGRIRAAALAGQVDDPWLEEQMLQLMACMVGHEKTIRQRIAGLPWVRASTRSELYRRLHLARDHMHAHMDEPFSLGRTAGAAALSPYHFLRSFRQLFGVTPRTYLINERIRRAQNLLRQTGMSVTEIAAAVGYESLPSFITLFRSRTKYTPAEYRRSGGK
jgi:AraC-like DNA-binding protein